MRLIIITSWLLALFFRANGHTVSLTKHEFEITQSVLKKYQLSNKINYIVLIDKNDCFNCTLSAPLIKNTIDSSQVTILSSEIPPEANRDFINAYGLSKNFNYIDNPKLFRFFKSIANRKYNEKSFIFELNTVFLTAIPLKKFANKNSFGKVKLTKTDDLYHKGHYISAIPKHQNTSNGYLTYTSPKNALYYFKNDSVVSELKYNKTQLNTCYNYVISHFSDSIKGLNSYSKSMNTFNQQLKKMGFSILNTQNFQCSNNNISAVIQFSFPIWTTSDEITFTGELFYCAIELTSENELKITSIQPINNKSLENGTTIFAYNFMFSDQRDQSLTLGFHIDSTTMSSDGLKIIHRKYSLSEHVDFRESGSIKSVPKIIIDEYEESENIALIHRRLEEDLFQYVYVPVIYDYNKTIKLFEYTPKVTHYHSYASAFNSNEFIDVCSVNGIYYIMKYSPDYTISKLSRLSIEGIVQSCNINEESVDLITKIDGRFIKGYLNI
jgi:hypothetical protein